MEESGQSNLVTAAFPPPPPFWEYFTPANLARLDKAKTDHVATTLGLGDDNNRDDSGQGAGTERVEGTAKDNTRMEKIERAKARLDPEELRALELPAELRYLVPPPLPTDSYELFGEVFKVHMSLPSLEDQGIQQLYPTPVAAPDSQTQLQTQAPALPPNHREYLLTISKYLLLNFLEFVGILSQAPNQFPEKLQDIRNLFINAHHLLNLYRPHQARESLILMMEEQLDRSREEIAEMDRVKGRTESFLAMLEAEGARASADAAAAEKEAAREGGSAIADGQVRHARAVWELLNAVE